MTCRLIRATLLASCYLGVPAVAQLRFDVASIKPTAIRDGSLGVDFPPGGRFTARNITVWNLLRNAYGLQDYQIAGGPDWVNSAGFDIRAVPTEGAGNLSQAQVRQMLQSLLAERFHLTLHHETRQRPVYTLVVGKNGPHLAAPGSMTGPTVMRMGQINVEQSTLANLCSILTFDLKRPVMDQTGLPGEYAIKLDWAPGLGETGTDPSSRPSLFVAVQEQLGLKLESTTGPVDVVVIDAVQRPDEN